MKTVDSVLSNAVVVKRRGSGRLGTGSNGRGDRVLVPHTIPGNETGDMMISLATCRVWAAAVFLSLFSHAAAQETMPNASGGAELAKARLGVEVFDDLVTVRAHEVRVSDVLEELALQTDLVLAPGSSLEDHITLELDRRPLTDVLAHVLRGRSFLLYRPPSASVQTQAATPDGSRVLWIFAQAPTGGNDSGTSAPGPPAIEVRLTNADVRVRRQAVKDARKLSAEEGSGPLMLALNDDAAEVRLQAIYGLADLGGREAVHALAAALGDASADLRAEAALALGAIGSDAAVTFLEKTLHDNEREVRESVIEALAAIGSEASSAALAPALRDPDASLRHEAVEALAHIGGKASIALLEQVLHAEDDDVRRAARSALAELSP